MPKITIIAIGNELIRGRLVDTNSSYIASNLQKIGVGEISIRLIPDKFDEIVETIRESAGRSDFLILTGGLGPTSDDGTRQAIAEAVEKPLVLCKGAMAKLKAYSVRRGRPLNENNRRQAYFPEGAEVITNERGTADAFFVTLSRMSESPVEPEQSEQTQGLRGKKETGLIALPGVPGEMKKLLKDEVLPFLQERFPELPKSSTRTLRCFGLPESLVGERIEQAEIDTGVDLSYRPQFPEIMLQLSVLDQPGSTGLLDSSIDSVKNALGPDCIFCERETEHLPETVLNLLKARSQSLSCAESCSGGLLADSIIAYPGASSVLLASVVAYSDAAKSEFLAVDQTLLEQHGAVSAEVVRAMAAGVKLKTGSDFALSISGIAGPDGGTEEKPVGTVWIGFASAEQVLAFHYELPWSRDSVRRYSVYQSLDILRRHLLGFPFQHEPNSSL